VTDGVFIQSTPSQAILQRRLNGLNHLSGNNAEEGPYFVPQNITTEADLLAWLRVLLPLFTTDDIAKLLYYYPTSNSTTPSSLPKFATAGDSGATAINVSVVASGQQQRANNIYAETTFICPSYWLAEAYNSQGRAGYKYQYSVPWAAHGSDTASYFGPPIDILGPDFVLAFQKIWGNFIRTGNPSVSSAIVNGASANGSSMTTDGLENWPPFTLWDRRMANLNQTGGSEVMTDFNGFNVTEYTGPGLRNNLRLVDAYSWEGGRGVRCDYWKAVADIVPA
jgi:carboxylesterase type B